MQPQYDNIVSVLIMITDDEGVNSNGSEMINYLVIHNQFKQEDVEMDR